MLAKYLISVAAALSIKVLPVDNSSKQTLFKEEWTLRNARIRMNILTSLPKIHVVPFNKKMFFFDRASIFLT